jgi:shikimate dehydrogenase
MADHVISGRTEVLAILGDPIRQARTPELVNAELACRGIDAVLVPLQVTGPGLPAVLAGLRSAGNVRGMVVTMPHKQSIAGMLDGLSPAAREAGACNVVRFNADRAAWGEATDGRALVAALEAAGVTLKGERVFMAGAGGAARAIAFALARAGAAALGLYNRTRERASELAEAIRGSYPEIAVEVGGPDPGDAGIAVNATPVGIDPARRELPFDVSALAAGSVVADIVISARPTALVEAARARQAIVIDGEDMLRAQVGAFIDIVLGVGSPIAFSDYRLDGRESDHNRA